MESPHPDSEPPARDRSVTESSSNMLLQLCRSAAQRLGVGGYKLDVKQQTAMGRDMTQEERKKRCSSRAVTFLFLVAIDEADLLDVRGKELDDGFFEGYADTFDKYDRVQAERRQKVEPCIHLCRTMT